ncbi:MAG: OmpA family protein [Actinomycetota bacterium]
MFSWTSAIAGALATVALLAVIGAVAAIVSLEEPTEAPPETASPTSLAWMAATTVTQPERTGAAGAEGSSPSADAEALRATQSTVPVGLLVDPDGDGVVIEVDADGAITMAGEVPDLDTVRHLEALFAGGGLADSATTAELVVAEGAPAPTGRIVIDNNLLFPIGGDALRSPGTAFLTELARTFEQEPGWAVTITVHTDNTGGLDHNRELSAERAEAVLAAMADAGVAVEAMTAVGAGMEFPVGDNRTVVGRNQNRRVEIQIVTTM